MDEQPLDSEVQTAEIQMGRARADDGTWRYGARGTFEGIKYEVFGYKTEREAIFALWEKAFPGKKITLAGQAAWEPLLAVKPDETP